MRRRIAGLCALIALVFSFVETAHASTCEIAAPAAAQHSMPNHMPAPADQHHDSMPNCPLSAGQIGCSTATSLPATQTVIAAAIQHVATFMSSDVVLPHSLRTTVIFHPPRF